MPRRKRAVDRDIAPDPKYNSVLVAKFINRLMERGKKSVSQKILYTALNIAEEKTKKNGLEVFEKAIKNVQPVLEVRSRRIGGATYQVPVEVSPSRRLTLAIRWLITYSSARSEKTMAEKLASEFIAASNNEGACIKKKEDTHKMAEANKAFAHFKW